MTKGLTQTVQIQPPNQFRTPSREKRESAEQGEEAKGQPCPRTPAGTKSRIFNRTHCLGNGLS